MVFLTYAYITAFCIYLWYYYDLCPLHLAVTSRHFVIILDWRKIKTSGYNAWYYGKFYYFYVIVVIHSKTYSV